MINEYLKNFDTHTEYLEYLNSGEVITPNVSHCDDLNDVHYNNPIKAVLHLSAEDDVKIYGIGEITNEELYDYKQNLQSVEIGASCTKIGVNAFSGCTILMSATIGDNVTVISSGAFRSCYNLSNVSFGSQVEHIGVYAFKETSLSQVVLPDSVISIGEGAFDSIPHLQEIVFGSSLSELEDAVFVGCLSLSQITCKANIAPSITSYTFLNISQNGTLYVPVGSTGYDTWINILGSGWTIVEE